MLYLVEAHTSIERANAIDAGEGPGPVFGKIGHRKGKHSSEGSPHERIKLMMGEQLPEVEVTERGVLGDRAYALIDTDTGRVVSAKSVKLFPGLLNCKAEFVEPPRKDGEAPAVQILLPDGRAVRSDAGNVDLALSA
jgi:hypothetical protein